jgi:hypothetical protein
MEENNIQKCCETLEDLLDRSVKSKNITKEEFEAINLLLYELDKIKVYNVSEYLVKRNISTNK